MQFSRECRCDDPDNLLSCHRVQNPGQHQPRHRDEQGPEDLLHLLVLPERIDRCIRVRHHTALDQLRQEDKERQEQNRSGNECQGDLGPACKPDPCRDRNDPSQDTGHTHFTEPEPGSSPGNIGLLRIGESGQVECPDRVQHPAAERAARRPVSHRLPRPWRSGSQTPGWCIRHSPG